MPRHCALPRPSRSCLTWLTKRIVFQSAWASFWDAFEILGLVITRVKVPRASHSWMVCIDLLTALSCWIIPPLVWVSFHYGEACDPDECVPRRQVEDFDLPGIDMVPIYLAIVIGYVFRAQGKPS